VFSDSLDTHNRNVQRWREQSNKAKAAVPPGSTVPNHDDRTENLNSPYGAAPIGPEIYARLDPSPPRPSLAPDPSLIARLAPVMPEAPEPPRHVAEYVAVKRPGPVVAAASALDDSELGVVTVAESNLDGPTPPTAASLDGPAAPVESSALGYSGAPVHAAPNGKPRILDASEGTALDPLLNKSWDLNSPKTVDPAFLKTSSASQGGK
jgi:UPF0755 protein